MTHRETAETMLGWLDQASNVTPQDVALAQVHATLAIADAITDYLERQHATAEVQRRLNIAYIEEELRRTNVNVRPATDHEGGEGDPLSFLIRGEDGKYHPLEDDDSARS